MTVTERSDAALGGDGDRGENYLAPTILRDAAWTDPVMAEEIFGPILPVIPVDGIDEAVAVVNDHDKPLALYVFAEDEAVIEDVIARTSSGGVGANVTLLQVAVPDLPFGGVGESGTARTTARPASLRSAPTNRCCSSGPRNSIPG